MKIILVILCSYFILACAKKTVHTPLLPTENHLNELNQSVQKSNELLKPKKVLISFVGDVILHERIRKRHDVTNEGFDSIWSELQTYFDRADLRYANLEGPVAPQLAKPSGFPRFNYPERIIEDLKKSGFDVVSTANNHSLDRGSEGVIQTIKNLDQHKLSYTGTIKNQIKAAVDPTLDKKTNQDTWWVLTDVSPEIKHKKISSGMSKKLNKFKINTNLQFEEECQIPSDVTMEFDILNGSLKIHKDGNMYAIMHKDHEISESFN